MKKLRRCCSFRTCAVDNVVTIVSNPYIEFTSTSASTTNYYIPWIVTDSTNLAGTYYTQATTADALQLQDLYHQQNMLVQQRATQSYDAQRAYQNAQNAQLAAELRGIQQQMPLPPSQERANAEARAKELLLSYLTPEQQKTFKDHGWFVVEGGRSKTKYRIRTGAGVAGNIQELNSNGHVAASHCCHASDHTLPHHDHWLAQKTMLECAEDDFRRVTNRMAA